VGSAWATVISQILLIACTAVASRDVLRFDFYPKMTVSVIAILAMASGFLMGANALV
jgi:hypothetical protein